MVYAKTHHETWNKKLLRISKFPFNKWKSLSKAQSFHGILKRKNKQ